MAKFRIKAGPISAGYRSSEKTAFAQRLRKHQTPAERCLWSRLRRRALGVKFMRQRQVAGFIADFYCAERKLVIEVDGGSHQGREKYDSVRSRAIVAKGFRVVRFANETVLSNLDVVVNMIREIVR